MNLGESLAKAAVRETFEESGIACEIISLVLTARAARGLPAPSDETPEVRWVPLEDLDGYQMNPSMRLRVQHYAEHWDHPYIGTNSELGPVVPAVRHTALHGSASLPHRTAAAEGLDARITAA